MFTVNTNDLRHDNQSMTFKVGDTKTFSYNIIESVNRVDVIDIACEEYVQEVLEISESGNPTSPSDLMIDSRSPSFTPFGGSDFLMEEIDAFLEHDDSIPTGGLTGIYDYERRYYLPEELIKCDQYDPNLPPIRHHFCEINVPEKIKSSCEDPPDLELKDLPSHLEYAFLEGDDKLPIIIAKNLKDEDKTALIKVKFTLSSDSPWIPLDHHLIKKRLPSPAFYGTFAYRRLPFGLCRCNQALSNRCMVVNFHDMIRKPWKSSWMISRFSRIFPSSYPSHLDKKHQVLVNGSPTAEFDLFKGLRQWDPLSPFLFILAMEGLHAFTCKAEEIRLFKGASIGWDNMNISHLMYAEDVIFFGQWSRINAHNLICMLCCFFLISGLKINVNKSNVIGIGISDEEVSCMASVIGCGVAKLPLKNLGVSVGCNMSRCSNWNAIIQNFSSKLSLWKARLLSVGGHLSLIKSVIGNLPTYYMSIYMMSVVVRKNLKSLSFIGSDQDEKKMTWVKWNRCLASKNHGGLGIGTILGLILGFCSNIFGALVLGESFCLRLLTSSRKRGVLRRYPRGGAESSQFDSLQAAIENVSLSDQCDSWQWSLDVSVGYSVASLRALVDAHTLDVDTLATRWNSYEMAKDLWALLANWWELDILMYANILECPSPKKAMLWDSIVSQSFLWISYRNPKLKFSWVERSTGIAGVVKTTSGPEAITRE
ncbi:hypothetical protein Tco_0743315 [Tanacetum coccineum]